MFGIAEGSHLCCFVLFITMHNALAQREKNQNTYPSAFNRLEKCEVSARCIYVLYTLQYILRLLHPRGKYRINEVY